MRSKLDYLRAQAAAYLTDADAADDLRDTARLVMLASRCRDQIHELEHRALEAPMANSTP